MRTLRRLLFCMFGLITGMDIEAFEQAANNWPSQEMVVHGADKMYRERIAQLERGHQLDQDAEFLRRVSLITQKLIANAQEKSPQIATWPWEIHTTNDEQESAFCMAGGKILVSENFVQKLELNDSELAMLLSHELQHALLLHHLKEFQQALTFDPTWQERGFEALQTAIDEDPKLIQALQTFNTAQEFEADQKGLSLAIQAGWQAKPLIRFFKKLAKHPNQSPFSRGEHPSASLRWQKIQAQAQTLEQEAKTRP